MVFDVAVVGLGLIGSAALRHLAATGLSVVGIGPGEPDDWAVHDGPFASHYDSGRVTRRIDARPEWAILATRAIDQYPVIEDMSGLGFHSPSGHMFVRNDARGIADQLSVADELAIPLTVMPTEDRRADVPYLAFPDGFTSIHERAPAGHIDPRTMIQAQLAVATRHGAVVHRVAATRLAGRDRPAVLVDGSRTFEAERVLLATGPYPSDLLAEPLAVAVRPEAVIMAELTESEADRLRGMPSVVYLLDDPVLDDTYFVPPVRYPDGRLYVKMGGSRRGAGVLDTDEAKRAWMSGPGDEHIAAMRSALTRVLPGISFESWHTKPCLISDTRSGLPYVDRIGSFTYVAVGGNGHAAKSADAIGALAAGLIAHDGTWTDGELDRSAFAAQFGRFDPGPGSRHGAR